MEIKQSFRISSHQARRNRFFRLNRMRAKRCGYHGFCYNEGVHLTKEQARRNRFLRLSTVRAKKRMVPSSCHPKRICSSTGGRAHVERKINVSVARYNRQQRIDHMRQRRMHRRFVHVPVVDRMDCENADIDKVGASGSSSSERIDSGILVPLLPSMIGIPAHSVNKKTGQSLSGTTIEGSIESIGDDCGNYYIGESSTAITGRKYSEASNLESMPSSAGMDCGVDSWDSFHKRTVFESSNFGGPSHVCTSCGAHMWYEERTIICRDTRNPKFNLCCRQGSIRLPPPRSPPPFLHELLYTSTGARALHFKKKFRAYNAAFQLTSIGAKIDHAINRGRGPYTFRVNGRNFHLISSLLPLEGQNPKFAQIYMYDGEEEIDHRLGVFQQEDHSSALRREIIEGLTDMLNACNAVVQSFRYARDMINQHPEHNYNLRLVADRNSASRNYAPPVVSEIAALIPGDIGQSSHGRDVIVHHKKDGLRRINDIHPLFMPMQYPLLFPYGEDSFHLNIPFVQSSTAPKLTRKCLTMRDYYAYMIQQRCLESNTLLRGGRLFQQFVVDVYAMIEETRLRYVRDNQTALRRDMYENVRDAISAGDLHGNSIGGRVILPASFVAGPRYLFQNYQDALAICRRYGYPSLFITFTCNPRWSEITEALSMIEGQQPEDRPDIVVRVFRIKLRMLMDDLIKKHHFGKTIASLYTVEFQKRGLPHAHILLWLDKCDTLITPRFIDRYISAEIPDKEKDPIGYSVVTNHMIHGPCGHANPSNACMKEGKCSKKFPKEFANVTSIDEDGFPVYRRRDGFNTVIVNGIELDNRFVVPHNIDLCVKYQAHINVEVCSRTQVIKYLFKYLNKGSDRANVVLESVNADGVNEVNSYLDCRYLAPHEACWRIFEFPIHVRDPSVQRLAIHLENQQHVYFRDSDSLQSVIDRDDIEDTMFTQWMAMNRTDEYARTLFYVDFPSEYTWIAKEKRWRQRRHGRSIGRIMYVPPVAGEIYYLRLLLNVVRGPRNFQELRTVEGIEHATNKEACAALGLLDRDRPWVEAIADASETAAGPQIRRLFVILLTYCNIVDKVAFFDETWRLLSEDIRYNLQRGMRLSNYKIRDEDVRDYTLASIENYLRKEGSSLEEHELPAPASSVVHRLSNRLMREELDYDLNQLQRVHLDNCRNLNAEQATVYGEIRQAVDNGEGGLFFVYGHGGTGKTFLWNTIIAGLRSTGRIVLAVASSGIASLLLPGGRTAHSRFRIPLQIDDNSTCKIFKKTELAALIQATSLIIWDEAPMIHRNCLEALDKTLRDVMYDSSDNLSEKPFGGKTVVLGGDFRQILPVVSSGTKSQIIDASICNSSVWSSCKVLKLRQNMRLQRANMDIIQRQEIEEFAEWILSIGDGNIRSAGNYSDLGACPIEIPEKFLIHCDEDPIRAIVDAVYPDFKNRFTDPSYLSQRAIVTSHNDKVDEINDFLLRKIPGNEREYYSSDSISKASGIIQDAEYLYPPELLNKLNFPGIARHMLKMKVGCMIMLLRNIGQSEGLCNGTRLIVHRMSRNVIEADILSGSNVGHRVYIPRIVMTIEDRRLPFVLNRRQFPIRLAYAMTINKSQGQTLDFIGVFLPKPVFTHGQLYVALSRVTSPSGLKILILDEEGKSTNKTTNVVFPEIFTMI